MANINNTTPAAPSSAYRLGKWQVAGRDTSVYVPRRPDLDFTGGLWGMRLDSLTDGHGFCPYGNTGNAGITSPMACPLDGYIRSMRARISTIQINGKTISLALFRTLTKTNLIATIPPLAPVDNYANDVEAVALRRGELFGFQLDVTGVAAGSLVRNVSGEYTSTDNSSMLGWSGENATVPLSTTHYTFLGSNQKGATESEFEIKIGIPGTIKNLFLRTGGTQSATGSLVVTLRKNGAATALTFTIAAGKVAGPYTNLTNSVAVVANDRITVELVNNATAVSALLQGISLSFTPISAALPSIISAQANTTLVGTVTKYYNLFNTLIAAPGNTDEIAYPMPRAGIIGDFKVQGGTAGNAGSQIVWELYKNGAATGYKKTLGGNVATAWFDSDAGSAIHFDLNDLAWVQVSHTGAGTDPIYGVCFSFTPDLVI